MNALPAAIVSIQTAGEFLNWHPHLHVLAPAGASVSNIRGSTLRYSATITRRTVPIPPPTAAGAGLPGRMPGR